MRIRLTLSNTLREQLLLQLHQAYRRGHLRLLKRIHALLYVSEGKPVSEVMAILQLSQQSVYNYVKAFILHGLDSLHYQRPSGRPPKLTKSQKQELCVVIDQGPEAAGYDCGCWTTALLQDVILTRFGIEYHPHSYGGCIGIVGLSNRSLWLPSKCWAGLVNSCLPPKAVNGCQNSTCWLDRS